MNQIQPEISVIVPVYNVDKYLRECLDSIVSQTFHDWECLLIDDGSPDNSGAICEEYAAKDSRFKVIHCPNGGVSAARNAGLDISKGRYISFVDPDDIVHVNMLQRLRDLIVSKEADVVQVGFECLFTTFVKDRPLVDAVVELDRGEVARELLRGKMIPCYVWNKLFRREVIDTPFPEGMVFEDMYVMSQWVNNIRKMVISPEILYSYRQRSGSIVNSNYAANRMEYLKSMFQLVYSLRALDPVNVSASVARKCIWKRVVGAGKDIARNVDDIGVCVDSVNRINKLCRSLLMPAVKAVGFKMWFRLYLMRKNPEMFVRMMRFEYIFGPHKYRKKKGMF